MRKPDVVFNVYVSPVKRLHVCAKWMEMRENGCSACHPTRSCPDCRYEETGWEMWGENHHCQGSAPTRARLAHWLKTKAQQQWRMKDGRMMGYRFHVGSTQTYLA